MVGRIFTYFNAVKPDEVNPDPTVFIFNATDNNHLNPTWWQCLFAGNHELGKYVKNPKRYQEIITKNGSAFVSSVNFVERHPPAEHLNRFVRELRLLNGSIVFGNPCLTALQSARWLESANFACCPSLVDDAPDDYDNYAELERKLPRGARFNKDFAELVKMYRERYDINIDLRNWTSALIQFAIPFAKHKIVVIAPDHFEVGTFATIDARRFEKHIELLPLSYFSANEVEKSRKQYIVEVLDNEGNNFPPELEGLLGESKEENFLQLPQRVRDQLNVN